MEFTEEFTENNLKQYILEKEKQLIEHADEDPFYVLGEVFNFRQWSFISDELSDWLIIGLSTDYNAYDNWGARLTLVFFYDQLLLLIEALFIIYSQNVKNADKEEKIPVYEVHLLSEDQKANPQKVIFAFFETYPTVYIIRELDDWLIAGLCYPGSWRKNMISPLHLHDTNRNVLCLIKAAKLLLAK
ncbi:MAG: hypothetical protein ABI675_00055 [Chitinophagaceae bacterium]